MFNRLSISTKIVLGFALIVVLMAIMSTLSFSQFARLSVPLESDIPQSIERMRKASYLETVIQRVKQFDQLLTKTAKDYVTSGDKKLQTRYKELSREWTGLIETLVKKSEPEQKKLLTEINLTRVLITNRENNLLEAMETGNQSEAIKEIESGVYWQLKNELKAKIKEFSVNQERMMAGARTFSAEQIEGIINDIRTLTSSSIKSTAIMSTLFILLAFLLALLITRSILKPLNTLEKGVEYISKGHLDHVIEVDTSDEMGKLASSLNSLSRRLKNSYLHLQNKVDQTSAELASNAERIKEKDDALQDASRKVQQSQNLVQQEKVQFEAIFESIDDGLIVTNESGDIVMANAGAVNILGFESERLMGKPFDQVIHSYDEEGKEVPFTRRPISLALASQQKVSASARYQHRNGQNISMSITASPVFVDSKMIGIIETFRPITERVNNDPTKTELITSISHEVKEPLSSIWEGVSLIKDGVLGKISNEQKNFLFVLMRDVDRLKTTIDHLLDLSKIDAGTLRLNKEFLDFDQLLENTVKSMMSSFREKGVEIKISRMALTIPPIHADQKRMEQVIRDILAHALARIDKGMVEVVLGEDGRGLTCQVVVDGAQVSEEDMVLLFERVVSGKEGGEKDSVSRTHNLARAKSMVELHHGKVWAVGDMNQGMVITLALPKVSVKDAFRNCVARGLHFASTSGEDVSLLLLNFKSVKEDEISKEVWDALVTKLKTTLRDPSENMAHAPGKFLFVLFSTSQENAEKVSKRVSRSVDQYITELGIEGELEVEFGISSYPDNGSKEDELLFSAGYKDF